MTAGGAIGNAVLIAGPTAGGKSAAALDLARRENRVIVNADSMQVYRELEILTARPGEAELEQAPHLLYGHVAAAALYSVGGWAADVRRLAESGAFERRAPIFVGGTGLYFRALYNGLAELPEIPAELRLNWRSRLEAEGAQKLHEILDRLDPLSAAKLQPKDGQRIARALEVHEATGRPLAWWQANGSRPLIDPATAKMFVIEPPRAELVRRIDARFDRMMERGALAEARRIGALNLDPSMPALKAIGVRELLAADRGESSVEAAIVQAKAATRRYAKRQSTWFRHQAGPEWRRLAGWFEAG